MRGLGNWISAIAASTVVFAIFLGGAAQAATPTWRITGQQGLVRVAEQNGPSTLARPNQIVAVGATVTTGALSNATIENGLQKISMTANSRMTIAAGSTQSMMRIIQDFGTVLFKVDHREVPHFRVETPLLAAVVKGTTFTVSTGAKEDRVEVIQGLVEVRNSAAGSSSYVPGGGAVVVLATLPEQMSMSGGAVAKKLDVTSKNDTLPAEIKAAADKPADAEAQKRADAFLEASKTPIVRAANRTSGVLDAVAIIAALLLTMALGRGLIAWLRSFSNRTDAPAKSAPEAGKSW